MYLRTPKKYQPGGGRRHVSKWSILLFIVTGLGVILAYLTWENRETLHQITMDLIATAQSEVAVAQATRAAPTPTPGPDPMICYSQGNAAYETGDLVKAIRNYKCALDGRPNDLELHTELAFLMIVSGQQAEALEVADRAILADPTAPAGYAVKGMALDWYAYATGQEDLYGEALAYELKALEIDPNYADAYAYMAEIYNDMGRYQDAYEMAEKALEIDPENFKAHRNYGTIEETFGEYESAASWYEKAIRLNPRMPYVRIQLARMYLVMGRIDAAVDLLVQSVQITSGDPESYYWLGIAYSTYKGDRPAARRTWETCVQVDPAYTLCWQKLGDVLLFDQEYEQAVSAYERALQLGGDSPALFYYAALTNQLLNKCNEAIQIAQQGLELEDLEIAEEEDLRTIINECQSGTFD
ncbi:MAG: tetratricopeptide repeat protein [Anaerolineae bacterium]|nr:tetratricopeptide repeat protein [Anaerolineae bacterium]